MKKTHKKTPFKASDFLGNFQPKIKKVKEEPRQRIRQFLRTSIPLSLIKNRQQSEDQVTQ